MNNVYFFALIILALFLLAIANKKDSKFLLIIGVIIISCVSGLRGMTVGIDTPAYYNAFLNNFPKSWQFEEIGFRFISMVLMDVFKNPQVLFFVYALITNLLIILRLWDFRKKCNFSVMVFLYFCIYFIDTMNIMRQFLAMAIIFFSTKLLENRKYTFFLLIVIATSFIHKTSLLALLLIVIYMWNNLTKKQRIAMLIPTIIISFIGLKYIIQIESAHINNYFSTDNYVSNLNFTFFYRVAVFIFSYLLIKGNKKITIKRTINYEKTNSIIKHNNPEFTIISSIYFFGLCFGSMGMFYFIMSRIGYYYLIFELVYWGYIINNSKNKMMNFIMIAVYAIYIIVIEIIRNGSGIFPYYFNI